MPSNPNPPVVRTQVPLDLPSEVQKAIERAKVDLGHVNVLIAGKTGVGKSTLINAVFHGNYAETGQGKPVTREVTEITKEGYPLTIFDTRGLEMADFESNIKELEELVRQRAEEERPERHIHVAWICIQEDGRRVEDAEIALHEMLARHMPVIAVITKAESDGGFRAEVQRLLPQARNVVRVNSKEKRLDDLGIVLPVRGLDKLVELTLECIPEGARSAFVAAQKASMKHKVEAARRIVDFHSKLSATAGASPIPFSDAAVLVPNQVLMLAKITGVFGLELGEGFLMTLLASVAGTTAATLAGRALVSNLLKLIPGVGTVAGGAISGATAAALTKALGEAYIKTICMLVEKHGGEPPSQEEIAEAFKRNFKG